MSDTGLRTLSVNQMVSMLSRVYISLIKSNIQFKLFPSVMLWGPPGVGKSQGVREIAHEIENKTKKDVHITDVRLLLFNPVDLRGIPTANEEKTLAVWLKPQIFQMDESDEVVNILFLDEITAAPTSVQAAAYQITLDRTVGEHKLPENCIVIAAGNRVTDRSVAYNMPRALANRLCHLEIKEDSVAWHDWAVKNSIHPFITGYMEYHSSALLRSDGPDLAFPTPRSWEMASNVLNYVSDEVDAVFPLIVGCISDSSASLFRTWTEIYLGLPEMDKVFRGEIEEYPKEKESQIALKSAMVDYARKHPDQKLLDTSIEYACRLPWAFRGRLLQDYYRVPELREYVQKNEVFQTVVGLFEDLIIEEDGELGNSITEDIDYHVNAKKEPQVSLHSVEAFVKLKHLCETRIYDKYDNKNCPYAYREMEKELNNIRDSGAAMMIMTVYEALKGVNAKQDQYRLRGTLGSSLLLYLLDFSEIDPLNCVPRLYPAFCNGADGKKLKAIEMNVKPKLYKRLVRYFEGYTCGVGIRHRHFTNGKLFGVDIYDPHDEYRDNRDDYRFCFLETKKL